MATKRRSPLTWLGWTFVGGLLLLVTMAGWLGWLLYHDALRGIPIP